MNGAGSSGDPPEGVTPISAGSGSDAFLRGQADDSSENLVDVSAGVSEAARAKRIFDAVDKDASGFVDHAEMRGHVIKHLVSQGMAPTSAMAEGMAAQLFQTIDIDGDGRITAAEWVRAFAASQVQQQAGKGDQPFQATPSSKHDGSSSSTGVSSPAAGTSSPPSAASSPADLSSPAKETSLAEEEELEDGFDEGLAEGSTTSSKPAVPTPSSTTSKKGKKKKKPKDSSSPDKHAMAAGTEALSLSESLSLSLIPPFARRPPSKRWRRSHGDRNGDRNPTPHASRLVPSHDVPPKTPNPPLLPSQSGWGAASSPEHMAMAKSARYGTARSGTARSPIKGGKGGSPQKRLGEASTARPKKASGGGGGGGDGSPSRPLPLGAKKALAAGANDGEGGAAPATVRKKKKKGPKVPSLAPKEKPALAMKLELDLAHVDANPLVYKRPPPIPPPAEKDMRLDAEEKQR